MANRIIRNIPNTLTCLNLLSGCLACAAAFAGDYVQAFAFIVVGAAFDFFDGLAARALHVYSVIGKDLDSLADDVTFGVAPGAMVFMLLREMTVHAQPGGLEAWLPYVAFAIPVFSGLRLAKFNNDARQTTSFIGLPVPANALFWGALIAGQHAWLVSGNVSPLAVAGLGLPVSVAAGVRAAYVLAQVQGPVVASQPSALPFPGGVHPLAGRVGHKWLCRHRSVVHPAVVAHLQAETCHQTRITPLVYA